MKTNNLLIHLFLFLVVINSKSFAINPLEEKNDLIYRKNQDLYNKWSLSTNKENPNYIMIGLSGKTHYFFPVNLSREINNPIIAPSFELFIYYNRFHLSLSTASSKITTREDIIFNISENEYIEDGSTLKYSLATIKAGYSVIFNNRIKVIPYAHYGIGDLFTDNYIVGNEKKTKSIYEKISVGTGLKAQYFIFEKKPGNYQGVLVPKTLGITLDFGYNYQFSSIAIPFKGHMGYISIGIFAGLSFKNNNN